MIQEASAILSHYTRVHSLDVRTTGAKQYRSTVFSPDIFVIALHFMRIS
jgi:hypothetical protein